MSHLHPIELICYSAIGGCLAFYKGCQRYLNKRQLHDTPISKLAGAAEGFIEATGKSQAMPGNILRAPLSGEECCAYKITIQKNGRDSSSTIRTIKSQQSFLLQDEQGCICSIKPGGAKLKINKLNKKTYYRDSKKINFENPAENAVAKRSKIINILMQCLARSSGYRFIEVIVPVGETLFVSGYYHLEDSANTDGKDSNTVSTVVSNPLGCISSKNQSNSDHQQQSNNSFLISNYSKQQVMKKDIWLTLVYFLAALILFPLSAYFIVIFQGRYFINL